MIRPFTLFCFLLACGSGLYLYQSKHRAHMMDNEIEKTVHATEAMRDQSRLLNAEWMLLNDPERLRALADQFLALRTVQPAQFTTMADLDHRLPPVRSPDAPLEPVPEPAVMTPMVPITKDGAPAAPPSPPVAAAPALAPVQATPRPAPAPLVAERKPTSERPAPERTPPRVIAQADPRPAEPRYAPPRAAPAPRYVQAAPVATPFATGSALGMAASGSLPPPKPVSLFQAADH